MASSGSGSRGSGRRSCSPESSPPPPERARSSGDVVDHGSPPSHSSPVAPRPAEEPEPELAVVPPNPTVPHAGAGPSRVHLSPSPPAPTQVDDDNEDEDEDEGRLRIIVKTSGSGKTWYLCPVSHFMADYRSAIWTHVLEFIRQDVEPGFTASMEMHKKLGRDEGSVTPQSPQIPSDATKTINTTNLGQNIENFDSISFVIKSKAEANRYR